MRLHFDIAVCHEGKQQRSMEPCGAQFFCKWNMKKWTFCRKYQLDFHRMWFAVCVVKYSNAWNIKITNLLYKHDDRPSFREKKEDCMLMFTKWFLDKDCEAGPRRGHKNFKRKRGIWEMKNHFTIESNIHNIDMDTDTENEATNLHFLIFGIYRYGYNIHNMKLNILY